MARGPSARMPVPVLDAVLALFVAVAQVQGVDVRGAGTGEHPITDYGHLGVVLLVTPALALAGRRRWPLSVFVVAVLASVVYYGIGFADGPGSLALWIALYSLTAHGDGRRSVVIAGIGIAILAVVWLVAARDIEPNPALGWVFWRIGASGVAAAFGESVRARRVIAEEAVERAELAERTRDDEARARVDAERLRIAREVHDTVAHSIAIINVQAGVTAHVLDKRPERARETLEAVERTSSQALDEMRAILGVLRDAGDDREPQPGLDRIDDLAARARDAGIEIELDASPLDRPLPGAVDSAAYRILQESITNVIRHVGPTTVTVTIGLNGDTLDLRVRDDGPRDGRVVPAVSGGRGLLGMQERCELLGGQFRAGPRPGGGFEVVAALPLVPAQVTAS